MIQATHDISDAQYTSPYYKYKNPISVTVATDGTIVVSKNNGTPGPKAREKAREIFGDDVKFANGRDANYDHTRWEHTTNAPTHAEARGIHFLLKNGISVYKAKQATNILSCKFCRDLQDDWKLNNISGSVK